MKELKRLAFIYNASAGKSRISPQVSDIADIFVKGGYEPCILPTQSKFFCRDYIAENAPRFDVVAVSGGDGTLNEAVNGLMRTEEGKRPLLGYIPSGSTNDFAASAGLEKGFLSAAEAIAKGNARPLDVGRFNDKYFAYVAAFGAFTDVAYTTSQQFKNIFGHAAYILEGIKRISAIKPHKMKVVTKEGEIEGEFIYGMVSNTVSVGGMKALPEEEVDLNDGLFEVILVNPIETPSDLNQLITDFANKSAESRVYRFFKAQRLEFVSEEDLSWTLDGEFGGAHSRVEIENIHSAVRLLG